MTPPDRLLTPIAAWAVLLALLAATLGSAFVPLGWGNTAANLFIAACKAAVIAWYFMRLRRAGAARRIVAAVAAFTLALLFALSGADYATRQVEAAPWVSPR